MHSRRACRENCGPLRQLAVSGVDAGAGAVSSGGSDWRRVSTLTARAVNSARSCVRSAFVTGAV
ncbi:MAG: hypothetical protein ACYDH8_16890 [Syntrophales bacterium]